ncbi:hypothetical protein [Lactobacillus mulieris]|uniref:Integral membrane protein n=1 Tax=Lactobacillus mulieris TaxID=2508708 RepID=A0AAW5WZL9_9LACO|nr:hypothetical protein [Lactobacillus mulieris]MCZ3622601.1 hypothetical protein [Lactobacillus mulieris]MCZ3624239.1 hypothetical protein [Lactobacillus mulieris]MCZ3636608.1 hypothetical protein [Lactobacillus mulieris]MCZ3690331.1 hypothetical protein [Lactobacillus mulieris]MCZ3696300.1 hypothetical protein [Lactobacillus mulieris]
MEKKRVYLVFVFLLLIPYLCSLAVIGIGYNALVLHSSSIWRSTIGALMGSFIMFAIKATIQRPLDLMANQINEGLFEQFLRFFSVRRRPWLQLANIVLDFILCYMATFLVRTFLNLDQIVGNSVGITLIVMFVSTCIGAYLEYDNLSIDPRQH